MDSTGFIEQAHQAIRAGQKVQARHLLQQSIRQNPQDYRAWLWLASVTASPQASLEYVKRAEMLKPESPHVKKARAWAEMRVEESEERGGKSEGRGERGEGRGARREGRGARREERGERREGRGG